MDRVRNPYSPGAGRRPAAFVGRDDQLRAWFVGLQRVEQGRTARSLVLYGLRGVGKTVLLNQMRRDAEARGWIVAKIEAGSGKSLRQALGESLYGPLSDIARPSAGRRLLKALKTAVSFKAAYDSSGVWSFGLDLSDSPGGGADSGILESDLTKLVRDLAEAAGEEGKGFAILVDEAQDLEASELTALAAAVHQATQDDLPCLVALAGLPSLPRDLAEAKSYAERLFDYHAIQALSLDLSRQAISAPASEEGVGWDEEALDCVVSRSSGYPYFLQQFGESAWNHATDSPIQLVDAEVGTAQGIAQLDAGFFRSRWDRATPAEREYLRAMSEDGDAPSNSGEVARRLGRTPTSLGPIRAKLIAKGLVYAPEHGRIAFTVPRMADFIARQSTD